VALKGVGGIGGIGAASSEGMDLLTALEEISELSLPRASIGKAAAKAPVNNANIIFKTIL